MANTPTDMQQATEPMPTDMPMAPPQAEAALAQVGTPDSIFSQETMEGAAKDAKMKFVTSVIERHLSNSDLEFEHLHEKMSAMTNDKEPVQGIMIAVTPKSPDMTREEVVASIQDSLGQIPIIQDQYNGLISNKGAIQQKISEAAKADDSDKVNQLLDEYSSMAKSDSTSKKFAVDFPVGNSQTYHVRMEGITLDDMIKSLMQMNAAMPEQAGDQAMTMQGKPEPVADTAMMSMPMDKMEAARAVDPAMAVQQDMPQDAKWTDKVAPAGKAAAKDISPQGVTAEQMAAAGQANNR